MRNLAQALGVGAMLLWSTALVWAQEGDATSPPQTLAELKAVITQTLEASDVPGAQIVLIEDGEVSLSYNFGVSDRDAQTPVTDNTVFRAGSISKSFVGVAMMMAVEDGLLSLDMPIAEATPDVAFLNPWEETDPVRLAHVLEHTAGFYDISLREFLLSDPEITISEGLAVNPANRLSRWRPGTYYSYANSGPAIAAHALELVRGRTYDALLRDSILRPLGMEISDLQLTPEIEARLSQSYATGLERSIPPGHILMRPSGALNTTATELAQFVRMLIGRGQVDGLRLLSPESVDRIERSETLEAVEFYGLDTTYGLGNDAQFTAKLVMRGHDGQIEGFSAYYAYAADLDLGVVILINNAEDATMQALIDDAVGYLLHDFEPQLPAPVAQDEAELAAYAGYYISRTPRSRFEAAMSAFEIPLRVRYSDEEGLVVAGVPRIPNGEYTMRRPERAESSFARALDSIYRRELRYSTVTYVQIPLWQYVLRVVLSFGVAVGAILALSYEGLRLAVWIVARLARKTPAPKRRGPKSLRAHAVLAGLSVGALVFLFYDISTMHYTQLHAFAEPTPVSIALFILTILAPIFAAMGLWVAIFGEGEAGRIKRGYHVLANGLILGGFLWLSQWGWIGVRVWEF